MVPTPSDILGVVMSQKSDVAALFDELRTGSRDGDGVTRDTYGPGEEFAHRLIAAHAENMGLETRRDHAANLFMTLATNEGIHLEKFGDSSGLMEV